MARRRFRRRARPAEIDAERGNPGHRAAPIAPTDILPPVRGDAPDWLTPPAAEIWRRYAPELAALNVLRATDSIAFGEFCEIIAEARAAKAALDAQGWTYEAQTVTGGKMLRINPQFMILDRNRRHIQTMADRFGLTPMARLAILSQLANNPSAAASFGDPRKRPDDEREANLFDERGEPLPVAGPLGFLAN